MVSPKSYRLWYKYYRLPNWISGAALSIALTPFQFAKHGREFSLALCSPQDQFCKAYARALLDLRMRVFPLFIACQADIPPHEVAAQILINASYSRYVRNWEQMKDVFHAYYGFNFKSTMYTLVREEAYAGIRKNALFTAAKEKASKLRPNPVQNTGEDPFAFLDSPIERQIP